VTHDQTEAMTMADKIVVLRDGRIEQTGRPLDLYNQPANRFVGGFIGSPRMNFLSGRLTGSQTLAIDGLPALPLAAPLAASGDATLGIRPEHIRLSDHGPITATATSVEQLGSDSYLYCKLPGGQALTIHHAGQTAVERGAGVALEFLMAQAHVFDANGIRLTGGS